MRCERRAGSRSAAALWLAASAFTPLAAAQTPAADAAEAGRDATRIEDAGTRARGGAGGESPDGDAAGQPAEEFTPSERISQDYSVDFPVDI